MSFQAKKAQRSQVKLKMLLAGPSGSGKTMSALRMAYGITGDYSKIVVIDAENNSASLYSHLGEYFTIDFTPPFSPKRYVEAIKYASSQNIDVIIIDSISHEWDGEGGCLDILNKLGGKFTDWARVTPLHNSFIEAIKQCDKHMVLTSRTKSEHEISKDDKGKTKIEKVGTKLTQREGFEYELTIAFRINDRHLAEIDKDRTSIFKDDLPFLIDESIGKKIADWNNSGVILQKELAPKKDNLEDKNKAYNEIIECIKKASNEWKDKEMLNKCLFELGVKKSAEIASMSYEIMVEKLIMIKKYVEGFNG